MVTLADLKKNSGKTLDALIEESKKSTQKYQNKDDDRFWQPTVDAAGNGKATIRFLPAKNGEKLPWVSYYEFAFKSPLGKWYIERSLQSLGQKDPCAEYKNKIWSSNEAFAKTMKRKQSFVSNILVVNDPANPENNGKVFLFRYGVKIYEKIQQVLFPDPELGEQANDPTDFWKGQNFHIIIKMVGAGNQKFRSYDDSKFISPSAVSTEDTEIERIWQSQYSLNDIVAPSTFKTYDELKARLEDVMGEDSGLANSAPAPASTPRPESRIATPQAAPTPAATPAASKPADDSNFDLDSILEGLGK